MAKYFVNLSVIIFLVSFSVVNIWACACCADKGAYLISTDKIDEYRLGLLKEMKFGKETTLFTSDAGVDPRDVKGLPEDYNDDNYQAGFDKLTLNGEFIKNKWTLNLIDYKGRKGGLVLTLPTKMLKYAFDLEPDNEAPNHNLYKEFRFEGGVKGTGFLQPSIATNTKFFLVFRGKGNACDNASDFNYWRVEVMGKKAGYAFWGKME